MGFGVPIDRWLRGPLRDWATDLLDPRELEADGLLRPETIAQAWREHLSGTRNWQYPLWTVLMFQMWRRRWLP
jgi:asparagine synthase (glutamine-hydrolysing)